MRVDRTEISLGSDMIVDGEGGGGDAGGGDGGRGWKSGLVGKGGWSRIFCDRDPGIWA